MGINVTPLPNDPWALGVRATDVPVVATVREVRFPEHPATTPPDPDAPIVEHAIYYATLGWSVFPAHSSGAKKSHKAAKYSNDQPWGMTTDESDIRKDFKKWPDANVSIVTGEVSGIIVVETDTAEGHGEGADGAAELAKLEAEHGELPETRMAISPSGSIHRYYKHPGFYVINSESVIAPGVDVRGDGGMVLAPPSVMPARESTPATPAIAATDGKPAKSAKKAKPARAAGTYRWLNDLDIADAPQWLLDKNAPDEKPRTISERAQALIRKPSGAITQSLYGNQGGDNFWRKVNNLALDDRAGWVRALFGGAAELKTINGAQVWRVTSEDLGRDLEEDLGIAPTGIRDWGTEENMTAIDVVMNFGNKTQEESALWLCEQMGIDPVTLGWNGDNRKVVTPVVVDNVIPLNPGAQVAGLPMTLFDDVENFTKKSWLLKGVVAKDETSEWIAPPGRLKSALLTDMSVHIASGTDWRGYRSKEKCGVVYFAFERADLVTRRLAAHRSRDELKGLPIATVGKIINLMNHGCVEVIVATIRGAEKSFGQSVGFVIFDTLAKGVAAGGGDENQAKDLGAALANLRRVQELTGAHIAIINHTGKDEKRGARGSNSQDGDVDVMVQIGGEGAVKVATVTKANDRAEGELTKFKGEIAVLGIDEDGDEITTMIISTDDCGMVAGKPDAKNVKLTDNERRAMDMLYNALNDGAKDPPAAEGFPYGIKVIPIDTWRTHCKRGGISKGDSDDAFRKAFGRISLGLANKRKIGMLDDLVWVAYD
jgi:hypothetical protein